MAFFCRSTRKDGVEEVVMASSRLDSTFVLLTRSWFERRSSAVKTSGEHKPSGETLETLSGLIPQEAHAPVARSPRSFGTFSSGGLTTEQITRRPEGHVASGLHETVSKQTTQAARHSVRPRRSVECLAGSLRGSSRSVRRTTWPVRRCTHRPRSLAASDRDQC